MMWCGLHLCLGTRRGLLLSAHLVQVCDGQLPGLSCKVEVVGVMDLQCRGPSCYERGSLHADDSTRARL